MGGRRLIVVAVGELGMLQVADAITSLSVMSPDLRDKSQEKSRLLPEVVG
jgi:hypothetical protein